MTSAVSAVSALLPATISSGIFMARRFDKSMDNLNSNPTYSLANLGIAAAQGYKTLKALDGMAATSNMAACSAILNKFKDYKIVRSAGKVLGEASYQINPLIMVAGGIKVLSSEDKADALARETLALGAMFGAESLAKNILGMTSASKNILTGKINPIERIPLHKKLPGPAKQLVEEKISSFVKYCNENKLFNKISLKGVPSILVGLTFVAASIAGYELGEWFGNKLLGKPKETAKKEASK